ncbi:MAG: hypothetical protein JRG73_14885 [Deltaproteobacteria bacterium]|nr:hypothetical protein [Deltaproteobacteria bacterium]MBW2308209.1 hypothetical protein [Deltaproteobacteria bacterium]
MQERFKKSLKAVISDVFETMFFLFPQPLEEESDSLRELVNGQRCVAGHISLLGAEACELRILVPVDLGVKMAANFLGKEDAGVEESELFDVIMETANMVGGNLLNDLDPSGAKSISVPGAQWLCPKDMDTVIKDRMIVFDVDGIPFVVVLETEAM